MLGSLLFDFFFYTVTAIICLLSPLFYLFGQGFWARYAWFWSYASLKFMKIFIGLTYERRGEENIPKGPFIYAVKHQSAWETITCHVLFFNLCIVVKSELMKIPFFGQILRKLKMIGVDRESGLKALKHLMNQSKARFQEGRPLLIFPEGTRAHPEAKTEIQAGVVALYNSLQVPVVPVALNSGVFWPRRSFVKRPGKVIVEFLEPIPPGLTKDEFRTQLEEKLTLATQRLVKEAQSYVLDS